MKRAVHGVLVADKPRGPSSTQLLGRVRYLFGAAKAGHGGTLDPMATGLLPILLGDATKFAQEGLDADKAYEAEVHLGITTTTADAEGEVLETRPVACTREDTLKALAQFTGEIQQCPPMYSALKVDGKPLYAYARAGQTLDRSLRTVQVHSIELLAWAPPRVTIRVECSKGTYIRTLAEDIGKLLGCGAHLTALRRTRVGPLRIESSHSLDALESASLEQRDAWLHPVDFLIQDWPSVTLGRDAQQRFQHGNPVDAPIGEALPPDRRIRVMSSNQNFIGVGVLRAGQLHPQRLLSQSPTP
ncbi:MAG: tRNA pseudouridine(55) synthase TruB [Betaproteobacteria bacterium]|nr:tRNA pseudouridine(55) synthase TruB [Betaproteobacteria bacterium]